MGVEVGLHAFLTSQTDKRVYSVAMKTRTITNFSRDDGMLRSRVICLDWCSSEPPQTQNWLHASCDPPHHSYLGFKPDVIYIKISMAVVQFAWGLALPNFNWKDPRVRGSVSRSISHSHITAIRGEKNQQRGLGVFADQKQNAVVNHCNITNTGSSYTIKNYGKS